MTTTSEKPDRRTRGRIPPPAEERARPLPPAPLAGLPPVRRRKREGGVDAREAEAAVKAYQRRVQAPATLRPPSRPLPGPAPSPRAEIPSPAPDAPEGRPRNYPWHDGDRRFIDHPDKRLTDPIRKPLDQIGRQMGIRAYQFYADWLEIVEMTLVQLPAHLANVVKTKTMSPFPPGTPQEDIDRWNQIFARYGDKDEQAFVYQRFREAFQALLDATDAGICDFVGLIYQELEMSDKAYRAQYWTPHSVAYMMALMLQPGHAVYDRIYEALTHPDNIAGQAMLFASLLYTRDDPEEAGAEGLAALAGGRRDFFFNKLLPAAMPYYEPPGINEPCVGSGVLLLAAAASMPRWMTELGMMRFTGMDTDMLCVRMARINCMLYGLNSYGIQCWEAAQDEETLAQLHDPERLAQLAAIRAQLTAEREAKAEAHRQEEEALHASRAELTRENLHVEVEERRGRKLTRLKDGNGVTQVELF
ncbi:MAG: hypothetical protein HGA45_27375 [Chloroflexales bacterium]|nr:hypothetical protein [Chloroflexales bacterium]